MFSCTISNDAASAPLGIVLLPSEHWRLLPKGAPPQATLCYIPIENSNNFSMLVHGITQMIDTGKPAIDVRRTLLVTGALASLMDSGFQNGKRLETPDLKIAYKAPARSWYAKGEGS